MIVGDAFSELGEEALATFGDCTEQTRPVALARGLDRQLWNTQKPGCTWLNWDGFLHL